jgi:2-hydroxychromene-2-carboxylate isomerase
LISAESDWQSVTDEARGLLSANTERAMKEGAFGLPWLVATNSADEKESFWGFDHLGQVVEFLGLERSSRGGQEESRWRVML